MNAANDNRGIGCAASGPTTAVAFYQFMQRAPDDWVLLRTGVVEIRESQVFAATTLVAAVPHPAASTIVDQRSVS